MSQMKYTPWIQISDVNYGYQRDSRVLHGVSLEIRQRELILLTGRNGSGKTTLLRLLAGLQQPQDGSVRIDSELMGWRQARKRLLKHCCYLHQQPYLFDSSVSDNIAYGLVCKGISANAITQKVNEALERFDLQALATRHSRALSSGEKQRVALARAWVLKPRLLLLDEPLANMDQQARHRTLGLIGALLESDIGIVLTSHESQHPSLPIDRHLQMDRGRIEELILKPNGPKLLELPTGSGRLAPLSETHSGK